MLILALDTTTRTGSCALTRDGVVVHSLTSDPAVSHAEHLPRDLMSLLGAAGVGLDAVDLFAVATGPGSFTGLRVGIATMQGLAFATGKPLIGISALDALASLATAPAGDLVATWVDAWRGEVYAAHYENGHASEPATVEHPAAILPRFAGRHVVFIGDGTASFSQQIRDTLGDRASFAEPAAPMLAGAIARLAADAARAGARPMPDAIRPLYVRRLEAERARDARTGQ